MGTLQFSELQKEILQISNKHYGDHSLDAISGAGQLSTPELVLVFINPTHRNISTSKEWRGLKAPWIGCTNIWQLFADAKLIDESLNQRIQLAKAAWSPAFAEEVYGHVRERGLYITNLVKWAGLAAKLPERAKVHLYAPLLIEELKKLQAKRIIAFGQLTYEAMLRELHVKPEQTFSITNNEMLDSRLLAGIQTRVGTVTPCYFPVGQGIKNRSKAVEILKLAQQETEKY